MSAPDRTRGHRGRTYVGLLLTAALNVGLGYLAVIPFVFLIDVLGHLTGWLPSDTKWETDAAFQIAFAAIPSSIVLLVFGVVNYVGLRIIPAPPRQIWPLAIAALLTPVIVVLAWPSLWPALRWY